VCIILECFVNFLDDPYYEPLPWFMIVSFSSMVLVESERAEKSLVSGRITPYS